jgi:hypothetical protein
VINTHTRLFRSPIDALRPLVEAAWSGAPGDPFPRDLIRSWRRNPAGEAPLALLPGVTRIGHGPFSFRFESWDGSRWRVRVERRGYAGWHGFELREAPGGTVVTHTIELSLSGTARVVWPLFIAPVHDHCVEAIFDRMEEALTRGEMPDVTTRPMPWRAAAAFRSLGALRRMAKRAQSLSPIPSARPSRARTRGAGTESSAR